MRNAADDELPALVWDSIIDRVFGSWDTLTSTRQAFYLVEYLNFEIGNGGLAQYFSKQRRGS